MRNTPVCRPIRCRGCGLLVTEYIKFPYSLCSPGFREDYKAGGVCPDCSGKPLAELLGINVLPPSGEENR